MRLIGLAAMTAGWIAGLLTGAVAAQLAPGDIILTYTDGATSGGRTLRLDPATAGVTTLIDRLPAPHTNRVGNWVQMGPNNRDVWAAYHENTTGAMYVIGPAGTVSTIRPLAWRTDGFRLTDDGGITWSGYGGGFTDRLMRTDRSFGNLTTLVAGIASLSLSHQEIEDTGNVVAAFQSTSPDGGVAELDPVNGVVVKTLKGLGFTNTVDFLKGNGKVYATEFAAPGQPSAAAGSLFEIDVGAGKISSLIDATQSVGAQVDRLNWLECTRDHCLLLGARHKIFRYDVTAGKIVQTWTFEADRLRAVTGATVYGNRPLLLDTAGRARPGGTVGVQLSFPHARAPGAYYFLAGSLGLRPGIRIGGDWLDLQFDLFFFISLNGLAPAIFQGFQGKLDGGGAARAAVAVPALPALDGLRVFVGGVALIDSRFVVTNVEGFTIRK